MSYYGKLEEELAVLKAEHAAFVRKRESYTWLYLTEDQQWTLCIEDSIRIDRIRDLEASLARYYERLPIRLAQHKFV